MASTEQPTSEGPLRTLLREEARLLPLLRGVFRLDPGVYAAIEQEPHATRAAFTVVIATALLWGIGQASIPLLFLSIAGAIAVWALATALIWAVGALYVPDRADYAGLLRCLGFAFAWNALQVGSSLPFLGPILRWGALALWAASMVLAARQVLHLSTGRALAVCAAALALPFLVLLAGAS